MYNVLFYPDEIWLHSYLIVTINKLILLLCLMRSGHYLVCHHKITSLSRIPIRKKKISLDYLFTDKPPSEYLNGFLY